MVLPNGETGTTDDSYFAIPGECPIHTDASTIIVPPSNPDGGDSPGYTAPIGPGYQPSSEAATPEYGPGVH